MIKLFEKQTSPLTGLEKIWTNLIFKFFYNNIKNKFISNKNLRAKIYIDNVDILDEEIISSSRLRKCLNHIRTQILVDKARYINNEFNDLNFNNIPKSYIKSLFVIIASSNGYEKTRDANKILIYLESLKQRIEAIQQLYDSVDFIRDVIIRYKTRFPDDERFKVKV